MVIGVSILERKYMFIEENISAYHGFMSFYITDFDLITRCITNKNTLMSCYIKLEFVGYDVSCKTNATKNFKERVLR